LTTTPILDFVRNQHNAFFKAMAVQGGRWHLYRIPGTDRFPLLREDSQRDVPMVIAVPNVQAMTAHTLVCKLHALLRT